MDYASRELESLVFHSRTALKFLYAIDVLHHMLFIEKSIFTKKIKEFLSDEE